MEMTEIEKGADASWKGRVRDIMGDDCCTNFARCTLIFFNIIFVTSGAAVLGVGIWLKVDPDSLNLQHLISIDSSDKYISSTAFVLIGFGGFVFLVGALGCIGAIKRWKIFLACYIFFLIVIFLGEFTGGIMAAVYKSKVEDTLGQTLKKSLREYNNTQPKSVIKSAWDNVQKTLKCCGVTTYTDYKTQNVTDLPMFQGQPSPVPASCCKSGSLSTQCVTEAKRPTTTKQPFDYLYSDGCLNEVNQGLKDNITIMIGVGIGIAMIQLLGIILACRVWRTNSVDDSEWIN